MTTKKESLAANLKRLMDEKYKDSRNKPMSLKKDAKISLSSVQRALSGDTAPNLDTLEALAGVFEITVGELIGEGRPVDISQSSVKILSRLTADALATAEVYQLLPAEERVVIRQQITRAALPLIKQNEDIESAVISLFKCD